MAIFAVALAVRLLHIWQIRRAPFFSVLMGDARAYDDWAQQIARGDWIGRDVFYQAPLYPYFLGLIYTLFGHNLLIVRICQAIVGSLACVLLGAAAARLFSPRVGFIAGLTLALYAPAIFFDGLLQKSVLDIFFICSMLWIVSGIIGGPDTARPTVVGPARWFCLGLVLGGLSLTRENALVFVAVIVVWAILRERKITTITTTRREGTKTRRHEDTKVETLGILAQLTPAAVFLLGVALVLAPVAIRNWAVGGGFYVTTSQFGPNLYIGNNPRSDGTYMSLRYGRGSPEYERQDAIEIAEAAMHRSLTPGEVSSYWTDRALDFITSSPGPWMKLVARKFALLWNATEMLDTESQEAYAEWSVPVRLAGHLGHFGVLVPLACFGVYLSWSNRRRLAVVYAMLLAYAASVVMFYVFARYRYPLAPFLILFAAVAIAAMIDVASRANPRAIDVRRDAWALGGVALVAIFANWRILSTDLMRAITENNLATALQSEGRYDEATAHYQRAISLRSDYAPAYNNMGTALRAKGELDAAIATYDRALQLQPDYGDVHYNLANAYMASGRLDEAIDHFRKALTASSGSAAAHNNLGIALASRGNLDEAIAEFRQALQLDPGSARTERNLGDALSSQGNPEAFDHLRRAVELAPEDGEARYDLGSALMDARKLDEAIEQLRAAVKLIPDSAEAHNNLGIALASTEKLEEAIAEFREAIRLKPGFEEAQRNLAMAVAARRQ